jgi:5-methylcytosine-specific restriction protein A
MAWEGHPRTTTPHHRANRTYVLERDNHTCWMCGAPNATIADHIAPLAEDGPDHPSNMAPACRPCHDRKSSAEGNRARWATQARRPPEPHPGLT